MPSPACFAWKPHTGREDDWTYLSPMHPEFCCPQRSVCGWWISVPGWPLKHCPTSAEAVIWWQAILVFSPTQCNGGITAHFTKVSCFTNVMTGKHNSEQTCYSFGLLQSTAGFDLEWAGNQCWFMITLSFKHLRLNRPSSVAGAALGLAQTSSGGGVHLHTCPHTTCPHCQALQLWPFCSSTKLCSMVPNDSSIEFSVSNTYQEFILKFQYH